jgi:hypothetical protein
MVGFPRYTEQNRSQTGEPTPIGELIPELLRLRGIDLNDPSRAETYKRGSAPRLLVVESPWIGPAMPWAIS